MKQLKNKFNLMLTVLLGIALGFASSCGKTLPTPPPNVSIEFSTTTASVMENGDPITVTVNFSAVTAGSGNFSAIITGNAVYTDDYTTSPDGSNGAIAFTVATGSNMATFMFTPVDNNNHGGDKTVTFTIESVFGVVMLGTDLAITVTIVDDEVMPTSIATVRAEYNASDPTKTLGNNIVIEGVVTSNSANGTTHSQNIVVQDATAGIVVRFDADHTFMPADSVRVNVSGALIHDFNGFVQVGALTMGSTFALSKAMKIADGMLPAPEVVTIANFNMGTFQGKLVRINDVAFEGADGVDTYDGSQTFINLAGDRLATFFGTAVTFKDDILPLGVGSIIGIASTFNTTPQIIISAVADVSFTESAMITVTSTITNFGQVRNGMTSTPQSYTVTGANLLADLAVSVSPNFEISLDMTMNYGSSLTIMNASSAVTIFVRFAPSSNSNGALSGTITHSSFGAVSKTVSLMGEETGNASPGMPTDLFFSEYVEGSSNNKYLEIFNGTGSSVDLSDYQIQRYNNGGTIDSGPYALSGTLANGAVIVIANSRATAYTGTTYSATNVNSATFYNGDDAVVLYKVSTTSRIDIIGHIGCDPGSEWIDGTHSTKEKTLRRKSSVTGGVTTNPTGACSVTSFATMTTEWDVFDQDNVDGLGSR